MTAQSQFQELKQHLQSVIVGQEFLLERLMVALLTGGHVLLEGPPGLAKTTAVKTLAEGVNASFQRVQFTPDLMPSDVIGSEVLDRHSGGLHFEPGPIFNELVLADEINRAPPKVQSALLEAMAEKQVTAGGQTRSLPEIFLVLATQNPLEQSGTYPLPEAQLDRFMLHLQLEYPTEAEELEILRRDRKRHFGQDVIKTSPTLSPQNVLDARKAIAEQYVSPAVERYMVALISATRKLETLDPNLEDVLDVAASPRASLALLHAASAFAWLQGRDFVTPDDVRTLLPDVLRHRLGVSFSGRAKALSAEDIIAVLLEKIMVPVAENFADVE
jgi:MoxR-like ATPase